MKHYLIAHGGNISAAARKQAWFNNFVHDVFDMLNCNELVIDDLQNELIKYNACFVGCDPYKIEFETEHCLTLFVLKYGVD